MNVDEKAVTDVVRKLINRQGGREMKRYDAVDDDRWITEVSDGDYILFTDHEAEINAVKSEALQNAAGWNRTVTDLREEINQLNIDHEAAIKRAVEDERNRIMDVFDDMRFELPDFISTAIHPQSKK